MNDYLDLFDRVRLRPSMYFVRPSFEAASAFVLGFDMANEGGVLAGFTEWLIVRNNGPNNIAWSALVLAAAFPDKSDRSRHVQESAQATEHAINTLFELIREFTDVKRRHDGLRRIFLEYEAWLRRQSWYDPASPSWFELKVARGQKRQKKRRRSTAARRSG